MNDQNFSQDDSAVCDDQSVSASDTSVATDSGGANAHTTVVVGKYKITVVRDLCIGAASCVAVSPTVFQLDSENKAVVLPDADDLLDNILMAAQSCPTKAIVIEDVETGQQVWPV